MEFLEQQLELAKRERGKISAHVDSLRKVLEDRENELMEEADAVVEKIQESLNKAKKGSQPGTSQKQMILKMVFKPENSLDIGTLEKTQLSEESCRGGGQDSGLPGAGQDREGEPGPSIAGCSEEKLASSNIKHYLLWKKSDFGKNLTSVTYIGDSRFALLDDRSVIIIDMNGKVLNKREYDSTGESLAYDPKRKSLLLSLDTLKVLDVTSLEVMETLYPDGEGYGEIAVLPSGDIAIGTPTNLDMCGADASSNYSCEYYDDEMTHIRDLCAVAADNKNIVYLGDKFLRRVFIFNTTSADSDIDDFNTEGEPVAIVVFRGLVFVAEMSSYVNCWVNVYGSDGRPRRLLDWPKFTDGYNVITSLAISEDGQLIVVGKEGIKAFQIGQYGL